MGELTNIEWCDHTFNPWIGCTRVSPGCEHCYAEHLMDTRLGRVQWGPGRPRKRTSPANWRDPIKWNTEAAALGTRPRVFCASLADWLDAEVPTEWLADLLDMIARTPHLDWLLLTKRPQNFQRRLNAAIACGTPTFTDGDFLSLDWLDGRAPANVWIGTTVEDQKRADERMPALLQIPARVRFLSCEPLLGPVRLEPIRETWQVASENGGPSGSTSFRDHWPLSKKGIDWVICGGESGAKARPMDSEWALDLRNQCETAGVPFLFKQWGEWFPRDQWEHNPELIFPDDNSPAVKCGKKRAGRLLDGVEHNGFPQGGDQP